uniref:NACAD protein n=1 Tax=Steinernema glaseri TaxID=37863 RepID=A0A1I7YE57_9BILA
MEQPPAAPTPDESAEPSMDFLLDGIDAVTGLPIGAEDTEEVPDYSLFVSNPNEEDVEGICAAAAGISHAPMPAEDDSGYWLQSMTRTEVSSSKNEAAEQDEDSVDNLSLLASAAVTQTHPPEGE